MRNLGRILTLGVLWVAGCTNTTFDLLPNQGTAGAAGTGRAGAGMGGGGGSGRSGGAGAGATSQAGTGDSASCGPDGCGPPRCNRQGCTSCVTDADCANVSGKPHCGAVSGCVECRFGFDCTNPRGCDSDCGDGDTCDSWTDTCMPSCNGPQPSCSPALPVCDTSRGGVCLECDNDRHPCRSGEPCIYGMCGECLDNSHCPQSAPICHMDTRSCELCVSADECNQLPGPPRDCTYGRCVPSSSSPDPSP
jgi:hypothetical protein